MFLSSPSYAEWTKVIESSTGYVHYVDFGRIREHDGYVYYWRLIDFIEPQHASLSAKIYEQVDCSLLGHKFLSFHSYKLPMGEGSGKEESLNGTEDWDYPHPNSTSEVILTTVCDSVR